MKLYNYELRKSEYYDILQQLPKECFCNIPNDTIQATISNSQIYFAREYFEKNDVGRKAIFNYRDNDILKPPYMLGFDCNNLFCDGRLKIILQSLIEE